MTIPKASSKRKTAAPGRRRKTQAIGAGNAEASSPESPQPAALTLDAAELRSPTLLDVGVRVGEIDVQQGAFQLATTLRKGGDLFGEFATVLLSQAPYAEGQLFQDVFALFVAREKTGGFFVEVGTGDGKLISNTYLLEKRHGWDGIVVEPNPVFLPSLQQNRRCRIATDCVFDVTGRTVTFQQTMDPEFSRISTEHADLHDGKRAEGAISVSVQSVSLNDLLERMKCPARMDYLSLDVEGVEFDILQTFDFAKWRFDCITVEHNWTESREMVSGLLIDNGYLQVFEHFSQWDDWYVHRDVLQDFPSAAGLIAAATVEDQPVSADVLQEWSLRALGDGELGVAELLAHRAIEIGGSPGSGYRTLADIATRRGDRARAFEHWRAAIAADPRDYWAHIGLGELLARRGAIRDAVKILRKAVTFDGDVSRAQDMLAALRGKTADIDAPT